jgi:glycosyltransferase involved in cell wall biosynthesis
MVKDPHWALEVLSRLRSVDPRWRLLLIGRDFAESQIVSGYRYRDAYRARAAGDDVREGIVDLGYITDLPEALREVGFILSSSRREGNPVGIAEGAASAAVPVVRDWPMAAPYGGASRVFPADWIVADPVVAAQRVLAFDDESWVRAGHAARDYVVANLDWSVVAPRYLEIFSDHR